MRRKGSSLIVVLLCSMASLLALAGQSLSDVPTNVRDAGVPTTAIVHPGDSPGTLSSEVAPEVMAATLWDNGDTDGTNAYSHFALSAGFGFRRALLDDFVVPGGTSWNVTGFSWLMLWGGGGVGDGTGAEILFRADAAGSPGSVIAFTNVTGWSEVATGRSWFGYAEVRAQATFDTVSLGSGTYWVEFLPIGPYENAFGMIKLAVTGSQGWINYDDQGGLHPVSATPNLPPEVVDFSWQLLGSTYDMSFQDDLGRSQFCVNTHTGDYQWSILLGSGIGEIYHGKLQVLNGGTLFASFPTDPNAVYFVYDVYRHKANGYFYGPPLVVKGTAFKPATRYYSPLVDKNTKNDLPCGEGRPTET